MRDVPSPFPREPELIQTIFNRSLQTHKLIFLFVNADPDRPRSLDTRKCTSSAKMQQNRAKLTTDVGDGAANIRYLRIRDLSEKLQSEM